MANVINCLWTEDVLHGWVTGCGDYYSSQFNTLPSEQKIKWCPFCGRRIEEKPLDEWPTAVT